MNVRAVQFTKSSKKRHSDERKRAMHRLWLTALVHRDACRSDFLGYVQAVLWRLRGLKIRSRNRLAALMGRSPRAYDLWIARIEPKVRAQLLNGVGPAQPMIVPIVCASTRSDSIADTLLSLRAAGFAAPPLVLACEGGGAHKQTPELADVVSADGTWLCVVPAGDRLAPDSLEIYSGTAASSPHSWVIYADDDLISDDRRHAPHFKSSWNAELFEHHDYISGSAVIRVTPDMLEALDSDCWLEQLTKRAISRAAPVHVPAVLHHRRERPQPSVPAKPVDLLPEVQPIVTVIVPTRNRLSYLRTCVEGIGRTRYPQLELIVADNDSDEPDTLQFLASIGESGATVLRIAGPFNFSALNNAAVEHARGDYLCFLNNDVEIVDGDWLSLLVRQAVRADVGAVGARLLYPDGALQHAGVVTGVGGGAAHAHRNLRDEDGGYFLRDRLPQRVSAVTAACLVVSKEKFLAVGGFDEVDFPVAFNDVDLCLKLNEKGWQSFYEPRAILIHHESKSRGSDSAKENRQRFASELAALKRHWRTDELRDPFHHPHLSPFCEQFHIAV
jgi:GT2 family glycosyltransferase